MAQGKNAQKRGNCGKEWWGKRPLSHTSVSRNAGVMKFHKRHLHKIERTLGKKEMLKEL